MPRSQRWKIWLVRYVADPLIRALFATCRWHVEGLEHFVKSCKQQPVILSLWHENLLIMPYWIDRYLKEMAISALISKSRDGQLLETVKSKLPDVQIIYVGHNSRHASMKPILEALAQQRTLLVTPDGPQGPWRKAKAGVVQAALWSKAEIWALQWHTSLGKGVGCFHLPTPDRMKLPYPFQKLYLTLTCIGKAEAREELPKLHEALEQALSGSDRLKIEKPSN